MDVVLIILAVIETIISILSSVLCFEVLCQCSNTEQVSSLFNTQITVMFNMKNMIVS